MGYRGGPGGIEGKKAALYERIYVQWKFHRLYIKVVLLY